MLSERDRPPHIPHEQLPATVGTLSVALVRSNESLRAAHTLLARLQSEAEAVDAERTALKSEAAKLRSALVERQRELGAAHARSSAAVEAVAAAEGRATRAEAAAAAHATALEAAAARHAQEREAAVRACESKLARLEAVERHRAAREEQRARLLARGEALAQLVATRRHGRARAAAFCAWRRACVAATLATVRQKADEAAAEAERMRAASLEAGGGSRAGGGTGGGVGGAWAGAAAERAQLLTEARRRALVGARRAAEAAAEETAATAAREGAVGVAAAASASAAGEVRVAALARELAQEELATGHLSAETAAIGVAWPCGRPQPARVRVLCRLRPPADPASRAAFEAQGETGVVLCGGLAAAAARFRAVRRWEFDRVFAAGAGQREVFEQVRPMATAVLDGVACCVLAYGASGAGKTYTLAGRVSARGLHFHLSEEIMALAAVREATHELAVRASLVEVREECVLDLLADDGGSPTRLPPHGRPDKRDRSPPAVDVAADVAATSAGDVLDVATIGDCHRSLGNSLTPPRAGDPAGSAARGRVVQPPGAATVARHDGSTLTRLLRPALSPEARVALVCCIDPSEAHAEEALDVLGFASPA
ncbi:hypothetical protein EMIHUDRAFT_451413 [Emiliania huxleyi CCMP1516]|uniref:Kinesin motor domain-containing protein n=2 Tax=Emiliania huxleyi TaxID=2903 RepID=A0A0D3J1P8_EMIH1|nr:hypothetical protein EMIHUDRAFT_451413 [Emiliania huxleyi CCMP1516]EOD17433.1 hypothetical protein EMIHUDRAFT_451413 [Emiliania huxleyi CCMP1516]|eukprot:XP_005769862.1 hypothetical protein EMIHUDRAFT_451413 [Emiliania huxleyi CCMP1516]